MSTLTPESLAIVLLGCSSPTEFTAAVQDITKSIAEENVKESSRLSESSFDATALVQPVLRAIRKHVGMDESDNGEGNDDQQTKTVTGKTYQNVSDDLKESEKKAKQWFSAADPLLQLLLKKSKKARDFVLAFQEELEESCRVTNLCKRQDIGIDDDFDDGDTASTVSLEDENMGIVIDKKVTSNTNGDSDLPISIHWLHKSFLSHWMAKGLSAIPSATSSNAKSACNILPQITQAFNPKFDPYDRSRKVQFLNKCPIRLIQLPLLSHQIGLTLARSCVKWDLKLRGDQDCVPLSLMEDAVGVFLYRFCDRIIDEAEQSRLPNGMKEFDFVLQGSGSGQGSSMLQRPPLSATISNNPLQPLPGTKNGPQGITTSNLTNLIGTNHPIVQSAQKGYVLNVEDMQKMLEEHSKGKGKGMLTAEEPGNGGGGIDKVNGSSNKSSTNKDSESSDINKPQESLPPISNVNPMFQKMSQQQMQNQMSMISSSSQKPIISVLPVQSSKKVHQGLSDLLKACSLMPKWQKTPRIEPTAQQHINDEYEVTTLGLSSFVYLMETYEGHITLQEPCGDDSDSEQDESDISNGIKKPSVTSINPFNFPQIYSVRIKYGLLRDSCHVLFIHNRITAGFHLLDYKIFPMLETLCKSGTIDDVIEDGKQSSTRASLLLPVPFYKQILNQLPNLQPPTATATWRRLENALRIATNFTTKDSDSEELRNTNLVKALEIRALQYYESIIKEESEDRLVAMIGGSFRSEWWNVVMKVSSMNQIEKTCDEGVVVNLGNRLQRLGMKFVELLLEGKSTTTSSDSDINAKKSAIEDSSSSSNIGALTAENLANFTGGYGGKTIAKSDKKKTGTENANGINAESSNKVNLSVAESAESISVGLNLAKLFVSPRCQRMFATNTIDSTVTHSKTTTDNSFNIKTSLNKTITSLSTKIDLENKMINSRKSNDQSNSQNQVCPQPGQQNFSDCTMGCCGPPGAMGGGGPGMGPSENGAKSARIDQVAFLVSELREAMGRI